MSKKRATKPEATEAPPPAPPPVPKRPECRKEIVAELTKILHPKRKWSLKNFIACRLSGAFECAGGKAITESYPDAADLHMLMDHALSCAQWEIGLLRTDLDEARRQLTGQAVTQQPALAPDDQEPFDQENPE